MSGEEEVDMDPPPTGVLANCGRSIEPDTEGFCNTSAGQCVVT